MWSAIAIYLWIKTCILGNIALARTYMSAATLETERNMAMSLLASMQALGFILGPGVVCMFVCLLHNYVHVFAVSVCTHACVGMCALLIV